MLSGRSVGSSCFGGFIGMNGTHVVIANMKKILCIGVFCWAVMCLCAQPAGHFRQGDHHWDKVERLMAKNGYSHRLASFRTDDNYQFCNFFYDGSGRLVAIRDTVRNEYSLIDSLSYNDRGQMVRMSGWQLLNGVWENVYYIDYAYDEAGNRISRANYNNFDGDWELGGVYNYTYDLYGNIVLSQLTMGGIVFQKVEYTYSHPGGDLVCEFWYSWGDRLTPARTDYVGQFTDLMPTFAELAGVEAPENDGVSFLPTLLGKEQEQQHEYLYWEFPGGKGWFAVRWGDWKGLVKKATEAGAKMELFNLREDPRESTDVATDHPEVVARLWSFIEAGHSDLPAASPDRFKLAVPAH